MAITLDFLKELDRFSLIMKKRVSSQFAGNRESRNPGSGLIFRDFRNYQEGDDLRYIDWRLYARTEKLFIKRFEEERNLSIHVLLDASASMNYGQKISKFEYGAQLGLGFAYIALKNNEKFNFALFSEKLSPIKQRKGVNQLMAIVDHLNSHKPHGESKFNKSLGEYKKLLRSRSLIIIISDFLADPDDIQQALSLYKKSQVIMIQVMDPIEMRFALEGDFRLKDAESALELKTFVTERLRQEYRERLNTHLLRLRKIADMVDARYVGVSTDSPVFQAFYRILNEKR